MFPATGNHLEQETHRQYRSLQRFCCKWDRIQLIFTRILIVRKIVPVITVIKDFLISYHLRQNDLSIGPAKNKISFELSFTSYL